MESSILKAVNNLDIKISDYKVIRKIGEGGMSVVYLAEQISLRREVAVKVMRLEIASNDLDVQRFKHEAKTIAQLDHPNIINIYNIGQTSKGEIYFTMPYLNHGDFSSYILENELEFIDLLKSICDGLSFAHKRGVVHRDIKPENLLFDKFGSIRIADFGIALSKDGTRMTQEHQIVGSAQYMSPEQARSLKVDVHSDIYSLGIVIYERLTGDVPFDSDDSISILVDHVSMEPPKLSPKMRHWQALIDKCLAKDPADRFQSMEELKVALQNIPTSSFQRTNNSLQYMFADDKYKHLKWFIPSLLVLIIVAIIGSNSSKKEINSIKTIIEPPVKIVKQDVQLQKNNKSNAADLTNKQQKVTVKKPITSIKNFFSKQTPLSSVYYVENSPYIIQGNAEEISVTLPNNDVDQALRFIQWPYDDFFVTQQSSKNKSQENITDISTLLSMATNNINEYQLIKPTKNNATTQLMKVLELNPDNPDALKGIETIGEKYQQLVVSALNKGNYKTALKHVNSLEKFNKLSDFRNLKHEGLKEKILKKIRSINVNSQSVSNNQITLLTNIVQALSPQSPLIAKMDTIINKRNGPKIGETFVDKYGIKTVIVNERFAAANQEITVKNYAEFAKATNRPTSKCKHKGGSANSMFSNRTWRKPYFSQNVNHPVVCVTQKDASAYTQWLAQQTNLNYRLPTKQEWLLLSSNNYNNFKPCLSGNLTGKEAKKIKNKDTKYSCNDNYKFTAPVASFAMNDLKLYDVYGNASEWMKCQSGSCQSPVAMGSSWYHGTKSNTSFHSEKHNSSTALSYIGFRVVRDL